MSNIALAADRVQTGVRLGKRLVKVLKALGAFNTCPSETCSKTLCVGAFAGKPPLEEAPILAQVHEQMRIYGLDPASPGRSAQDGE